VKRNDWIFTVVIVAVFAVAGGVFLNWVHGFNSQSSSAASQPGTAAAGAGSGGGSGQSGTNLLVIPSIGANAPIVPEGASGPDGGALDVPSSVHVVGWWDGLWQAPNGTVQEKVAKPGQQGVALLAGHIDSAVQGHGALYRLQALKAGAPVTVYGTSRGAVTHWKVTRIQVVLKSALPAALFVNHGPPQLAVVSCGGPFDSATGHYEDNVIAWAVPA
jgi:hypothetical protein